jgi:hypothetical protein
MTHPQLASESVAGSSVVVAVLIIDDSVLAKIKMKHNLTEQEVREVVMFARDVQLEWQDDEVNGRRLVALGDTYKGRHVIVYMAPLNENDENEGSFRLKTAIAMPTAQQYREARTGMMKVVDTVEGRPGDDGDPELSWDDAAAVFGTGTSVELVRPARKVVILYRYADDQFHATSPDLTGFEVTGPTLYETKRLVRADLARYLDPAVALDEREPKQVPTEGTSHSHVTRGRDFVTTTASIGRSRSFISPNHVKV